MIDIPSRAGLIPEEIRMLYRMFLIHGAFVTEHNIRFDGHARDDYTEELKIRSGDGAYTAEIRINRPIGRILLDCVRHEPRYCSEHDLSGRIHPFIV